MGNTDREDKKIPALRTYAKDLEYTRSEKKLPHAKQLEAVVEPVKPKTFKKNIVEAPPRPMKAFERKIIVPKAPVGKRTATPIISENEDSGSATIITDTKKNRFKLFPAIIASIEKWFNKKKTAKKLKSVPKYSVPESNRRKGVIQKATSTTGKSVSADFSSIQERIKQRKEPEEKHEVHTTWSPNTEPGFLLLEDAGTHEEELRIANVTFEPRKSFITEVVDDRWEEEDEIPEEIEREFVAEPEPLPVVAEPELADETEVEIIPEVLVAADELDDDREAVELREKLNNVVSPSRAVVIADQEEPEESEEEDHLTLQERFAILKIDTNVLSIFVAGVILLILVIIFAVTFFFSQGKSEVSATPAATPGSLLINTETKIITVSDITKTEIENTLKNYPKEAGGVTQVSFAQNLEPLVLATPQEILAALNFSIEGNLLQDISQIRFGYTRNKQPFILMTVLDNVVAQGGLLVAEENLYESFGGLYGLNQVAPSIRSEFTDSAFSGYDVRIMKTTTGDELLLYGIFKNTVIITNNSTSFRELSILVK